MSENKVMKGINCIYLPVTNIEESTSWYQRILRLERMNDITSESTQAQFRITPDQSIFLIKTAEKVNLTYTEIDGNEQCILTLAVSNIRELYEEIKAMESDISSIEDNGACGLSFYVKDPDGNKIELWGGWA
ncbi:VOC family protein [Sutcliffiella rhizosphaerae]|uniref:VOC domain-containing protein n=1 Tax=Sutcliffiella rhizosphaerae TaxID=2880967 RepID=A0ABN8AHN0_9BACI|nr:VOC family protein [Sutcliffiella rhizosphaerae]CAG9623646.1 hypothetical protein BACCIP111883_04464 [Sutcliffiella rhizosphaerae]